MKYSSQHVAVCEGGAADDCTDMCADGQKDRLAQGKMWSQTKRHIDRQSVGQSNQQTDRQTNKLTDSCQRLHTLRRADLSLMTRS